MTTKIQIEWFFELCKKKTTRRGRRPNCVMQVYRETHDQCKKNHSNDMLYSFPMLKMGKAEGLTKHTLNNIF